LSSLTPGYFTALCQPGASMTKSPSLARFLDQTGGSGARMKRVILGLKSSSFICLTIVIPSGGVGRAKTASALAALALRIMSEKSLAPGAYSP